MKKLLTAIILVALMSCMMVGCTTAENPYQHCQRQTLQKHIQCLQLVEDIDTFWLCDRTSRLTKWHGRTGL
jgi:cytochrome c556